MCKRITKVTVLLLSLLLVASTGAGAQEAREGIQVHGDWVIEVRNPDGTLASRHEFKNALRPAGGDALARILARTWVPAAWSIVLAGSSSAPCVYNGNPVACTIVEPVLAVGSGHSGHISNNLTIAPAPDVDYQNLNPYLLRLSGSITAARAGDIGTVSTNLYACSGTSAPASCGTDFAGLAGFTSRTLPSPVPIAAGQIVQVMVTISFS